MLYTKFESLTDRELILEVQNDANATEREVALVERLAEALDLWEGDVEFIHRLSHRSDKDVLQEIKEYTAPPPDVPQDTDALFRQYEGELVAGA